MFNVEFGKHGVQPGSIRIDVDHIGGDVAAVAFEFFDLFAVRTQDFYAEAFEDRSAGDSQRS